MSKKGKNLDRIETVLGELYSKDYSEPPVSMERFLRDRDFLGNVTDGGKTIYPFWRDLLSDISLDDSRYLIVLSGAIGVGKTVSAIKGIAYGMHRILCVDGHNPIYDCEKREWVKLNRAYKKGLRYTLAVDENGDVGAYKVNQIIFSGKKPVYEVVIKYADHLYKRKGAIKSTDGRCKTIRTTLDHKFWTKGGWKPLKDILVGDEVLIYGDNLHLPRSEVFEIMSSTVKKIWASKTKEERHKICGPGVLKMNSPKGKAKANKTRKSKEYRDKISKIRRAYLGSLSLEERRELVKHLHTPEIEAKAVQGLIEYWKNVSFEEKAWRVLKRLESMDWEKWWESMESKVWHNPERNSKLSVSVKKYMTNLSSEELEEVVKRLHTPTARKKAVLNWKIWRDSLTQEQKNDIIRKGLETTKRSGDLEERAFWGYGKSCEADDGHKCDSKFEKRVDDWLNKNGIKHDIHVIVKNNGFVKSVDFFAGGWYIEVDGLNRPDDFFEEKLGGLPYVVVRSEVELEEKLSFLTRYTNSNFAKTLFGKVISIDYVGERNTYDVVMADDSPKNFICKGVVVHNCLKSPFAFFNKDAGGKLAIVFFNLTTGLGQSKGYNLLQAYLLSSPWFKRRGFVVESTRNSRLEIPLFNYKLASPYSRGFGFAGEDVIFAIMDEVDSETESEKQKVRVLQAYESAVSRFDSRFVRISNTSGKRETVGRFFLCASKQERMSFLNTFIVKMQNSPSVRIVEGSLWDVKKGDLNLSGKEFPIMLGDVYNSPKILGQEVDKNFEVDQEAMSEAEKTGYKIIQVPIEFLERFQKDLVGNLRRLAGVSIDQLRKTKLFPSEKLLVDCYDPAKRNPVKVLTIEVGLNDNIDFAKYIDFSAIRIPRHFPRYIHIDVAYSGEGDALGLGMSCISGWTERTVENLEDGGSMQVEKLPVVETDFGVRIKARSGDKIPLSKIRKLIMDLKKVYYFNIRLVTFDLNLLSEDSKQILSKAGIKCDALSLDRNPQIYRNFRNLVGEKRWCCHRDEWLHFELSNLEDDPEKNKVDHPNEVVDVKILEDGGTRDVVLKGSKDCSDGVVGSVENALRNVSVPASREFTDAVKKVLSKPNQQTALGSLLSIPKPRDLKDTSKEEIKPQVPEKFKDIFRKSQRK